MSLLLDQGYAILNPDNYVRIMSPGVMADELHCRRCPWVLNLYNLGMRASDAFSLIYEHEQEHMYWAELSHERETQRLPELDFMVEGPPEEGE